MNRYTIPAHLDDPELIGFWTLDEFLAMLLEPPSADDTGLEILERLFPGESATILDQLGQAANPNKTLRKGQLK